MIQYPKKTHITLPSTDGAFGTLNIMRDPPKSIHTRYVEKVGDTNKITRQVDEASDRICEGILPFPRGSNPMVDVSYQNYGGNAGQLHQFIGSYANNTNTSISTNLPQAKLPYRVMRDGAFRPPVRTERELLPLSRLPRLTTSQTTNPATQQFLKKIDCRPDRKSIREQLLNVCVPGRSSFNIGQSASTYQPYNVKYSINDNNIQGMLHTNISVGAGKGIEANKTPISSINQDRTYSTITANPSKDLAPPIKETCIGNQPIYTKDRLGGSYGTNVTMPSEGETLRGASRILERSVPASSASTNRIISGDITNQNLQRKYTYLPERAHRGSFTNGGSQPTVDRMQTGAVKVSNSTKSSAANLASMHYTAY